MDETWTCRRPCPVAYFLAAAGNHKTRAARAFYICIKLKRCTFPTGVHSSPRFEYSARRTAIKSFDKRARRDAARSLARRRASRRVATPPTYATGRHTIVCVNRYARRRPAFSFGPEKRMNVGRDDKRRVHVGYMNTRAAVCTFRSLSAYCSR